MAVSQFIGLLLVNRDSLPVPVCSSSTHSVYPLVVEQAKEHVDIARAEQQLYPERPL